MSEWGRGIIQVIISDSGTLEVFRARDLTKGERKKYPTANHVLDHVTLHFSNYRAKAYVDQEVQDKDDKPIDGIRTIRTTPLGRR